MAAARKARHGRQKRRALTVLLSEGSSTSAREAVTALGIAGHRVEIMDPNPFCIARYSRHVRRFHRCPGIADDPQGYLEFVLDLVARDRFDVLVPIHEQGLVLATAREQISRHTAIALPSFDSYGRALDKAAFSLLLTKLALPQPETRIVTSIGRLREWRRFPIVVKAALGTASRGVWQVSDRFSMQRAVAEIESGGGLVGPFLLQQFVDGQLERAQAVFAEGRLVGLHGWRRLAGGVGGGDCAKESVNRPLVREHLQQIGAALEWHGALSVDYIVTADGRLPLYIDCNPRLVEPMACKLAGNDLADILLQVSIGESVPAPGAVPEGVRTHLAMQALLGAADRNGSRLAVLREALCLMAGRGIYADSQEELTPVRFDWPSAVPLVATVAMLLAMPSAAGRVAKTGWGSHLLVPESIQAMRNRIPGEAAEPERSVSGMHLRRLR